MLNQCFLVPVTPWTDSFFLVENIRQKVFPYPEMNNATTNKRITPVKENKLKSPVIVPPLVFIERTVATQIEISDKRKLIIIINS